MSVAMKKTKKKRRFSLRDADLIWARPGETSKKRLFFEGFSARATIKWCFGVDFRTVFEVGFYQKTQLLSKPTFCSMILKKRGDFRGFSGFSGSGGFGGVKKSKFRGFRG
jgi:hypothetical protein